MARTVSIGRQDFEKIRMRDNFYVDKTDFIRQWWESEDDVTLITRPRRFGKTLNMSMLEQFFSVEYAGRGALFEGLSIWQWEKYRLLQGTYPVVALSFADVKETSYPEARKRIGQIITEVYNRFYFLSESRKLNENERALFRRIAAGMGADVETGSLKILSNYLMKHFGKKVIILLDEYDTPMQEAYVGGYWDEIVAFIRGLFNATFKTNPHLERAVMTGITRVSKGSIINFLDKKKVGTYWANTSSNSLVGKLLREGSADMKRIFEGLLRGESFHAEIDEQIVYSQLSEGGDAVWSLLLASGYLRVEGYGEYGTEYGEWRQDYVLALTNFEVRVMFRGMVRGWFGGGAPSYNDFIRALLLGDVGAMNTYMNRVTQETFSYFDTSKEPNGEPERFYHGFVLGLMVELADRYVITSNRESGFGRYDIMLEPRKPPYGAGGAAGDGATDAVIIEFKVQGTDEAGLSDTVGAALRQIEERGYQAALMARGIPEGRIRKYGFAFCGKRVLIGTAEA